MSRTFSSSRYASLSCMGGRSGYHPSIRLFLPHKQERAKADPHPQRNLNNAFAYDLVPSPSVVAAALKAARRVNDFATAVRIFEGMPA